MMVCSQCKKTFRQESKFCSVCGAPLTEIPEETAADGQHMNAGMIGAEVYDCPQSAGVADSLQNEQSAQPAACFSANPEMGAPPASYSTNPEMLSPPAGCPAAPQAGAGAVKTGAGAITGMFLVNCVPILGFPAAFLWAQAKMKRAKGKLAALTVAFIVLNIAVTLFAYAFSVNLMKNSLAKAAKSAMAEKNQTSGDQKLPGQRESDPSDQPVIPWAGENLPVQDMPGLDSGLLEQLMPGFPGMQGGQGYDSGNYQVPEGVSMPETDEEGNMHIDADGDGVVDMIIDKEGNIKSLSAQTPSVDSEGNVYIDQGGDGEYDMTIDSSGNMTQSGGTNLPQFGQDDKMYLDTDGDGKHDSYMDSSGLIIPMDDRTKTDAKGNRYIDYEGDGSYEYMIDTEGVVHFDADGDGKYEFTFDQGWGQG
jgi:hypothetical protein